MSLEHDTPASNPEGHHPGYMGPVPRGQEMVVYQAGAENPDYSGPTPADQQIVVGRVVASIAIDRFEKPSAVVAVARGQERDQSIGRTTSVDVGPVRPVGAHEGPGTDEREAPSAQSERARHPLLIKIAEMQQRLREKKAHAEANVGHTYDVTTYLASRSRDFVDLLANPQVQAMVDDVEITQEGFEIISHGLARGELGSSPGTKSVPSARVLDKYGSKAVGADGLTLAQRSQQNLREMEMKQVAGVPRTETLLGIARIMSAQDKRKMIPQIEQPNGTIFYLPPELAKELPEYNPSYGRFEPYKDLIEKIKDQLDFTKNGLMLKPHDREYYERILEMEAIIGETDRDGRTVTFADLAERPSTYKPSPHRYSWAKPLRVVSEVRREHKHDAAQQPPYDKYVATFDRIYQWWTRTNRTELPPIVKMSAKSKRSIFDAAVADAHGRIARDNEFRQSQAQLARDRLNPGEEDAPRPQLNNGVSQIEEGSDQHQIGPGRRQIRKGSDHNHE